MMIGYKANHNTASLVYGNFTMHVVQATGATRNQGGVWPLTARLEPLPRMAKLATERMLRLTSLTN